jgi:DNA-binding MarR family transcriptional regulator
MKRSTRRKSPVPAVALAKSAKSLRLDLPNFLPYRITVVAALIRRELANIYRNDPGLNEPEWKVFTALAHYGPLPSGDVGYYVTLDRVAVSRALARLMKLGLATRKKSRDDLRMFDVGLTAQATRVYDRMAREALGVEARILERLNAGEIRALLALLEKVEGGFRNPDDLRRKSLVNTLSETGRVKRARERT